MRRILLFALLLLPQLLQAQEVFSRPIAEDHKVWRHENMELPGNRTRLTYTEGDTILANQHYFKYYTCNTFGSNIGYYEGAIYDEGRKTYIIKAGETEPQLLYNFDVVVGDVITINGDELCVEKDTIMELNNELYRYLKLYNITRSKEANETTSVWWIEGIGALTPYLSHSTYCEKRDTRKLVACYVDQELVYYDEDYTLDVPILWQTTNTDNSLYDLSGRRVKKGELHKGVYIQGRKKFVVK